MCCFASDCPIESRVKHSLLVEFDLCDDHCDIVFLASKVLLEVFTVRHSVLRPRRLQRLRVRNQLRERRYAESRLFWRGQVAVLG